MGQAGIFHFNYIFNRKSKPTEMDTGLMGAEMPCWFLPSPVPTAPKPILVRSRAPGLLVSMPSCSSRGGSGGDSYMCRLHLTAAGVAVVVTVT